MRFFIQHLSSKLVTFIIYISDREQYLYVEMFNHSCVLSCVSFRLAKVAISKSTEVPLEDGLEIEKQCYSKIVDTKDRLEGLAAFAAKRDPVYQGV